MDSRKFNKIFAVFLASATFFTSTYVPVIAENAISFADSADKSSKTGTGEISKAQSKETENADKKGAEIVLQSEPESKEAALLSDEASLSEEGDTSEHKAAADSDTIGSFDDKFEKKKYPLNQAPEKETLIQGLPSTLFVTMTDGTESTIQVSTWECADYDAAKTGDYTFTPVIDDAFDYSTAPSIPWIEVCIVKNEVSDIQTVFEKQSYLLSEAPTEDEIENTLPDTLTASVNGADEDISILSWDTDYDISRAGVYTFIPVLDDAIYSYDESSLPTAVVELTTAAKRGIMRAPVVNGKVTSIGTFTAQVAAGATKRSNGDWVWKAVSDTSGHQFAFRVNYSTSGQGTIKGNQDGSDSAIKITIPKTILKDRSGERCDVYEMSVPERDELATMSESELKETIFAYYEEGNNIIVYNFKDLDAAQNGYFEVSYNTKDRTFSYKDYGATGSASSPFQAKMEVSGLTATTNPLTVYIDTTATINATYKYYPKQRSKWPDSWGQKPADADDYVWQRWEIRSDITDDPTQIYDFILNDEVTCSEVPVEVYGYQFSGSNQATRTNRVSNIVAYDGYRYDYVYTRIKKTDWNKVTSYTIHNKITATVHPVDGVDEDTSAVSTRDFAWTLPTFIHPTGHFYTWKFGNENWTSLFGLPSIDPWDFASYDLDRFQEAKSTSIDDIKYAIWAYGYPFPWTVRDGGSSDNWQDYGYKNVTYQVTDEAFYNLNMDGTYGTSKQKFAPDYTNGWETGTPGEDGTPLTPRMNPEDYDISYVSFSAYFNDVPRDANGHLSEDVESVDEDLNFNVQYIQPTDKDILTFWTKSGTGAYVKAGELNLGTGKSTVVSGGLISSITKDSYKFQYRGDYVVNFKDGVDGFRVTTTNNHYYTDIKMYPYISIKNTDRMLAWTGTGKITAEGSTSKDAVLVRNVSNLQVFDSESKEILDLTKTSGDRLRRAEKASEISKKVTGASNNRRKKYCTVSWKVNANETFTTGTGDTNDSSFISQSSGTFYDLLPAGATLQTGSVYVAIPHGTQNPTSYKWSGEEDYLAENGYTVETMENYKDSGRTMLIVRIKDPGSCYSVYYTTIHSWDAIADYGKLVTNPVAYETGNDEISGGFPDDPTVKNSDNMTLDDVQNKRSDAQFSAEHRNLYKDLDPDTNDYKFIYDEATHDIVAITAASSGLNKRVKSAEDSGWEYDTTVHPDETYTYRLRYANTFLTAAKDLILYDSLENYYKTDGAEKGKSAWYGTLKHIDTTQMEQVKSYDMAGGAEKTATLKPVVYVSTVSDLDLDVATNKNLTNTSVWKKLTDSTDLSKVKAIAYDLRKDSEGKDFVLKPGGSISSTLYLDSPHTITDAASKQYPETYNNVYLKDTVIGIDGSETPYDIHYDYTTVRYAVTASFGLHKISAKDTTQSIKDINFRLFGTSDYGTEINQITATDKDGNISFKNIEKGSYILQEYSGTPDWLEDHTEHKVVIDGNAKVTIDGTDYTDKSITIKNSPRIHADVEFLKREDGRPGVPVPGASFMLSGTSDYGNESLLYAKSEKGKVVFENVERGKYTLQETKAPEGYVVSPKKYEVIVDANGLVSFTGLTANKQGQYTILNEKLHKFNIIKRSSYDNSPIKGAEFHLTGTSDYGTKVDKTATSGENGFAGFEKLEAGTYLLQETQTDAHHQLDDTRRVVRINSDNSITIDGLSQSATDKVSFIWINTRIPDEEVTVIKEWKGGTPDFTEDNLPTIHLVAKGNKDYKLTTAYLSTDATKMIHDSAPVTFSRNTSLTEEEVKKKSGVQRLDSTADKEDSYQKVYGWIDENKNYYWWSNTDTLSLTDYTESFLSNNANLTSIDLTGIDITKMSRMAYMFSNNRNLININPEVLDTSHITNMESVFSGCSSLESLDLTSWDVSKVEKFGYFLAGTSSLQQVDITGWKMEGLKFHPKDGNYYVNDTSGTTSNEAELFYNAGDKQHGCHVIANNVKFPENMVGMFQYSNISKIDMNNVDMSAVISMYDCFFQCENLGSIEINNATNVKNLRYLSYCFKYSKVKTAKLSGFSTSENLLNASYMFDCTPLESIEQDLNTKNAIRLDFMFSGTKLTKLDLRNFDVSSIGKPFYDGSSGIRRFNGLYYLVGGTPLTELNISGWDLSEAGGNPSYDDQGRISYIMNTMCESIGSRATSCEMTLIANDLKLPKYCGRLFYDLYPTYVEMKNTDFSNVVYLGQLFSEDDASYRPDNCKLKRFDISGFGTKNIQIFNQTFLNRTELTDLDLSWLEASPWQTRQMFSGCSKLKNIYMSKNFDTSGVTDSDNMFNGCTNLPHFDSSKTDKTNANTSSTGYFILKQ